MFSTALPSKHTLNLWAYTKSEIIRAVIYMLVYFYWYLFTIFQAPFKKIFYVYEFI